MQTWKNLTFRQQLTEFKPGRGHPWREGNLTNVSSRRDPFLLVLQFDRKLFPQPFVWSDSIQCFTNQAHDSGRLDSSHNQNLKPDLGGKIRGRTRMMISFRAQLMHCSTIAKWNARCASATMPDAASASLNLISEILGKLYLLNATAGEWLRRH